MTYIGPEGELVGVGCRSVCGRSPLGTSRPTFHCPFDLLEEVPGGLCVVRGPELLEDLERVQGLRFRVFKPVLLTANISLHVHCVTHVVWIIDSVRFCLFDVGVCMAEFAFIAKRVGQLVIIPK
jgi:hypothetical protein